jgi:glycosyltransferase involved in cell wall biosynthesis
MKVLHLNANSAGGAFMAANRLSAALNESGQVQSKHLVFSGQPGQGYQLWAQNFFRKQWAFFLHAKEKLEFLAHEKDREHRFAFSHASQGIRIDQLPEVKEADVVHLHWINKGFISLKGLEQLYRSGKKVIWTAHDLWPFTGGCYHPRSCNNNKVACGNCMYLKNPAENDLSAKVFAQKQELYRQVKPVIVVPGKWSYDMAMQSGLSEFVQLKQIGHFIDTEMFAPGQQAERTKFKILFSSMNLLNPKKGIFDLATAINALPQNDTDKIELTLVGNAKDEIPEFNCLVKKVGVVHSQAALAAIYRENHLMIIPSFEETFGLTAAESQSCGLPVLAYASGELAWNIESGKTGWLCQTGDTHALQSNLLSILQMDIMEFKSFGERARAFAETKFGRQVVVDSYLKCYSEL